MSLTMRWIGGSDAELDRIAQTRMLCYAHAPGELSRYRDGITCQGRAKPGDYLIAERDGFPVGTATSLEMTMWLRGAPFSCQGVAYVGAIKTERRKGSAAAPSGTSSPSPRSPGVASAVMLETLRHARDRGFVLSSLSPWRVTFYEHFGYGLTERRLDWTIPLTLLPTGDFGGLRFIDPERDRAALLACQQRVVEAGQGDLEWPAERLDHHLRVNLPDSSFCVVDRPTPDGPIHGWLSWQHQPVNGKDLLKVWFMAYDSPAALLRQLHFLSSLRDQYSAVMLATPVDLQLDRLLREPQLPHRPVSHAGAECKLVTRLQSRVLDHRRLLEGLRLPASVQGRAVIAVHEAEGHVSRFHLDVSNGRASAPPSDASPDIELSDRLWASIVFGDLSATAAARLGLLDATDPARLALLDALCEGPAPFCRDYF